MSCPSATLAVWCAAWLNGAAASDDVLDALRAWGDEHEFRAGDTETSESMAPTDLSPAMTGPAMSAADFLTLLRTIGARRAWITLPVAGDLRGVGHHRELTRAALRAGEAAVFPGVAHGSLAVVGEPVAEGLTRWTIFDTQPIPAPEHTAIAEAESLLSDALRENTATLRELDIAGERPGVRTELADALRARSHPDWPPGMSHRALRVLQRADEIDAIVRLAHADDPGGAYSASAAQGRDTALRPLSSAARTARCAAVDEAVRVFSGRTSHRT